MDWDARDRWHPRGMEIPGGLMGVYQGKKEALVAPLDGTIGTKSRLGAK